MIQGCMFVLSSSSTNMQRGEGGRRCHEKKKQLEVVAKFGALESWEVSACQRQQVLIAW